MIEDKKLLDICEELKSYDKEIMTFQNTNFKPFRKGLTIDNGFYLTIRCGYSGIYTMVNEWKNGDWQTKLLDGSQTIAYDKNKLTLKSIQNET